MQIRMNLFQYTQVFHKMFNLFKSLWLKKWLGKWVEDLDKVRVQVMTHFRAVSWIYRTVENWCRVSSVLHLSGVPEVSWIHQWMQPPLPSISTLLFTEEIFISFKVFYKCKLMILIFNYVQWKLRQIFVFQWHIQFTFQVQIFFVSNSCWYYF